MKRYYLVIAMFFSIILAQFSTNNLNGFGGEVNAISTSLESMGGMWMNNSNIENWDPLLASSIYKSDLTVVAISSSLQGVNSEAYSSTSHNIDFVNFSFPIRKNMGIGLGLSPYTKTNYDFEESADMIPGTEFSNPLQSNNSYIVEGGISKLSLAVSKGIFIKDLVLSMGLKWNILFGGQKINTTTMLNQISYDQNGNQSLVLIETLYDDSFNDYRAYSYEVDSRITIKRSSFSLLFNLIDNFNINSNNTSQLFSYSENYSFSNIQLDRIGIGYMYKNNNDFGIAFEGHFKNSIDYPAEIMLFNSISPSKLSFHNGIYKTINNPKSESWNLINFRAGYSYKIIKFRHERLNDISISFGIGISFNNFKNDIDISFTLGSSQNIVETIVADNYYKLNIGILSGDRWFKKRRRK